ncbi:STAS domain-containing protein [Methylocystis sp. IM3]|jgi:anti-anti-sigma factor|uniref:STAS domain-containing protein n=1 Tax=unclassified Methylocystis TaxID=2625913 RepID=UPI000FA8019F|nr:MAG: anti-sigma factor antagonist [Hyphomicrobiales bacterium]
MDLSHEVSNGLLVVRPKSRIDSGTAASFETQCAALLEKGPHKIVIDLSEVDYVSSAGLRALLIAAKKAKSLGGALTLCGLRGSVSEVMAVSGFDAMLGAHPGVEEAAAALAG